MAELNFQHDSHSPYVGSHSDVNYVEGHNSYLHNVLEPKSEPVGIPDDYLQPYVLKTSKTTTSPSGITDAVFVWFPFSRQAARLKRGVRVVHSITGNAVIGWNSQIFPDEDLSTNYRLVRLVSGLLEIYSSTIPAGSYAIDGRQTSSVFYFVPDFSRLDPSTLTSYNTEFALQQVSVQDGISMIALPQGDQPYGPPDPRSNNTYTSITNRSSCQGSIVQYFATDAGASPKFNTTFPIEHGDIIFDSMFDSKTDLSNYIGKVRISVGVTVIMDSQDDVNVEVRSELALCYLNTSGTSSIFDNGVFYPVFTLCNATKDVITVASIRKLTAEVVFDCPYPLDRVTIFYNDFQSSGAKIASYLDSYVTIEALENLTSNYFSPCYVMSLEGFDSAASLTIAGTENFEAVPGDDLTREITPKSHRKDHMLDFDFAQAYIRQGRLARPAYNRIQYNTYCINGNFFEEAARHQLKRTYALSFKKVLKTVNRVGKYITRKVPQVTDALGYFDASRYLRSAQPLFSKTEKKRQFAASKKKVLDLKETDEDKVKEFIRRNGASDALSISKFLFGPSATATPANKILKSMLERHIVKKLVVKGSTRPFYDNVYDETLGFEGDGPPKAERRPEDDVISLSSNEALTPIPNSPNLQSKDLKTSQTPSSSSSSSSSSSVSDLSLLRSDVDVEKTDSLEKRPTPEDKEILSPQRSSVIELRERLNRGRPNRTDAQKMRMIESMLNSPNLPIKRRGRQMASSNKKKLEMIMKKQVDEGSDFEPEEEEQGPSDDDIFSGIDEKKRTVKARKRDPESEEELVDEEEEPDVEEKADDSKSRNLERTQKFRAMMEKKDKKTYERVREAAERDRPVPKKTGKNPKAAAEAQEKSSMSAARIVADTVITYHTHVTNFQLHGFTGRNSRGSLFPTVDDNGNAQINCLVVSHAPLIDENYESFEYSDYNIVNKINEGKSIRIHDGFLIDDAEVEEKNGTIKDAIENLDFSIADGLYVSAVSSGGQIAGMSMGLALFCAMQDVPTGDFVLSGTLQNDTYDIGEVEGVKEKVEKIVKEGYKAVVPGKTSDFYTSFFNRLNSEIKVLQMSSLNEVMMLPFFLSVRPIPDFETTEKLQDFVTNNVHELGSDFVESIVSLDPAAVSASKLRNLRLSVVDRYRSRQVSQMERKKKVEAGISQEIKVGVYTPFKSKLRDYKSIGWNRVAPDDVPTVTITQDMFNKHLELALELYSGLRPHLPSGDRNNFDATFARIIDFAENRKNYHNLGKRQFHFLSQIIERAYKQAGYRKGKKKSKKPTKKKKSSGGGVKMNSLLRSI